MFLQNLERDKVQEKLLKRPILFVVSISPMYDLLQRSSFGFPRSCSRHNL